jgi:hypothetical protein
MSTRVCTKCGVEKEIEEFPLRNQFTLRRQSYCKDCRKEYGANWYERNKDYQKENARKHTTVYRDTIREYLWNYLRSHPCQSCGESDPVVLEFHHLHSKNMAISELVTRITSIEKLEEELQKTQVLCANCHRKLTAQERGWFRSKK